MPTATGGLNAGSSAAGAARLDAFHWAPQPAAEAAVRAQLQAFMDLCKPAVSLAQRMRDETGTRFFDWLDHLRLPLTGETQQQLMEAGFAPDSTPHSHETLDREMQGVLVLAHPHGIFPRIVLSDNGPRRASIKVDSVDEFSTRWPGRDAPGSRMIAGQAGGQYRCARLFADQKAELWAVERHGYRGFSPTPFDPDRSAMAARHAEAFAHRQRNFVHEIDGFAHIAALIDAATSDIGRDWACDLFFAGERAYWQSRNHAARVQKGRQDRLGLGWANHDHHTYRSSREFFPTLIALLEKFGFQCRERFYAGPEAGWGAQVLEQPIAGIVIFADVDLSPDELVSDFSHDPLPPRHELGTVGLWCALHGEAILQAGMHHLECQFDFEALRQQLEAQDIKVMQPFTDFSYLRQAFTQGERWAVCEERIAALLARKQITPQQADQFRDQGAIGSHLENLERNQGFKGFNQRGVSDIISRTDPRKQK